MSYGVRALLAQAGRCSRNVMGLTMRPSRWLPRAPRTSISAWVTPRSISDWASILRGGSAHDSSSKSTPGLFGRPELQRPQDWQRLAEDTESRCDLILDHILKTTPADGVLVVALMDEMSDEICRTYDAAECCRNVHVDPAWRQAASRACVRLGEYVSRVNHHEGMYERLSAALAAYESSVAALERRETPQLGPRQLAGWCRESVLVAQKLKQDMEQAGIHLPPVQRSRMAELAAANGHFNSAFNSALTDPRRVGTASLGRDRRLVLDPSGVAGVMASEPYESVRRQVYLAAGRSPACNQRLLEDMIAVRRDMARIQGYPSYAALRTKGNSLAGTPSAVVAFLERLARDVRHIADRELQSLEQLKAFDTRGSSAPTSPAIQPWDVEYYAVRARQQIMTAPPTAVLRYTALPSVLRGVRLLLRYLFQMELVTSEAAPGEGWAPGVLRCEATHIDLGPLGVVYLDLGERPGKYPTAVTFPVTCGRQLPPSRGGGRQLPVMALLTPASGTCPASGQPALTYRELRTLLHELGHCVHNLLSQTKYQHLWGTRCAQDLVEVPSHLFEYFAADPRVMALLARDRSACARGAAGSADDGEALPPGLLKELVAGRSATAALELQQQLVISLADQGFFGADPPGPASEAAAGSGSSGPRTTSDVWRQAVEVASSVPYIPGTSPELRVGHLTIYGGAYYGYVYARCLAAQLWRSTGLEDMPLDPGAGSLLRERLLGPGGSLEPLHLLSGLAESSASRNPGMWHSRGRGSGHQAGSPPSTAAAAAAAAAAAVRQRVGEPWQQGQLLQRGMAAALAEGPEGLLLAMEGGFAPRPERYLEMLSQHRAA